jgi:hypothetical protein
MLKPLILLHPLDSSLLIELAGQDVEQLRSLYTWYMHCNENPSYVFPEKKLCGLSPNFHYVSVSDLWSVHIFFCSTIGRPIMRIYKSITDTWMWKWGLRSHNSFSGNICFEYRYCVFAVSIYCTFQHTVSFFQKIISYFYIIWSNWIKIVIIKKYVIMEYVVYVQNWLKAKLILSYFSKKIVMVFVQKCFTNTVVVF